MEDERYQKELFDFKEKPKKSFPKFNNFIPKSGFMLVLNAERMVFVLIGVIMLMVLVYALGVERGKAIDQQSPVKGARLSNVSQASVMPAAPVKGLPVKAADIGPATIPMNVTTTRSIDAPPYSAAAPYTIVAAAFRKRDSALKESERLKKREFDSFVLQSEPYYLTCIGTFPTKDKARTMLGKVRKIYKDAYVKLR